ncbi:MAG: cupin domain-containing protein [Acidobacteriia bacterium]|nr:cupin domain-containing protein [Terriglobia bacterium]
MRKINLAEKVAQIHEYWRPKIVGELNGQELKLVKFRGEFVWHRHLDADELFLGITGCFRVECRDAAVTLQPGDLIVVPHGVEHRTVAEEEAAALIFEPAEVRNTGDVMDQRLTAPIGERI